MFNYVYLLNIRNRLEDNVRKSFGSYIPAATNPDIRDSEVPYQLDPNDDDMSRLQEYEPDYGTYPVREQEFPDRPMPTRERDHSSWLNPYEQEERDYQEEYQWEIDFYERASTGDQYW